MTTVSRIVLYYRFVPLADPDDPDASDDDFAPDGGANVALFSTTADRVEFCRFDDDGTEHEVNRPVVALCTCGRSSLTPWCDGTHQVVRERAGSGDGDE